MDIEWKATPVKECSGPEDVGIAEDDIGAKGLGAIDSDITAKLIARTLKNMDCLVMGRSILISRVITAGSGKWLRIVTRRREVPPRHRK
jgi:hypothetical protein